LLSLGCSKPDFKIIANGVLEEDSFFYQMLTHF
jgi:hypothetical protein